MEAAAVAVDVEVVVPRRLAVPLLPELRLEELLQAVLLQVERQEGLRREDAVVAAAEAEDAAAVPLLHPLRRRRYLLWIFG